jgi:Universal stress protein UspA and related nucleotide-binding proteins
VQSGSIKEAILNTAKNWQADLIVLGTNSDLRGRRHLGSVSISIMEGADRPVLIVRVGPNSSHLQQGTDFTRVLLAIDDNDYSEGAVSWLARETWNDDTMFKVMMVVPEQQDNIAFETNPQKAAWLIKEWSKTREKVAAMLKEQALALDRGVENELVSIEVASGNTKERVVATARGWKADLLVMGSRGPRSGIKNYWCTVSAKRWPVRHHVRC